MGHTCTRRGPESTCINAGGRPGLPKVQGPHAEKGGEVLDGMYARGCSDGELTERMMCITSRLNAQGTQYEFPWQVRLERVQLRTGEQGDSAALVYRVAGSWDEAACKLHLVSVRRGCPLLLKRRPPKNLRPCFALGETRIGHSKSRLRRQSRHAPR
jgi:hypothetical protein